MNHLNLQYEMCHNDHKCAYKLYMKHYLFVNNYKHGEDAKLSEVISDKFKLGLIRILPK
jgi:hypothetical protein